MRGQRRQRCEDASLISSLTTAALKQTDVHLLPGAHFCQRFGSARFPLSPMRTGRRRAVRITSCHVSRRQQRNREIRLEPSEELQSGPGGVEQRADSPEAGHHAAEEEHAVALDEGGQEGEEAVDGHGNQQALFTAQLVRQAAPKEGAEHHPQIHDAAWNTQIKTD